MTSIEEEEDEEEEAQERDCNHGDHSERSSFRDVCMICMVGFWHEMLHPQHTQVSLLSAFLLDNKFFSSFISLSLHVVAMQ